MYMYYFVQAIHISQIYMYMCMYNTCTMYLVYTCTIYMYYSTLFYMHLPGVGTSTNSYWSKRVMCTGEVNVWLLVIHCHSCPVELCERK